MKASKSRNSLLGGVGDENRVLDLLGAEVRADMKLLQDLTQNLLPANRVLPLANVLFDQLHGFF